MLHIRPAPAPLCSAMTTTDPPSIATVWGIRRGVVLVCFTAQVDAHGCILRTSLGEPADHDPVPDRDREVRARLRQRYGPGLELRVIPDGGAGYARFLQDLAAQRLPAPPPRRSRRSPPR